MKTLETTDNRLSDVQNVGTTDRLRIRPNNGFLLTNTVPGGMNLQGDYYVDLQVNGCQEEDEEGDPVDLDSFLGGNINSVGGVSISFTPSPIAPMPEPSTLIMLAGASAYFVRRRKVV